MAALRTSYQSILITVAMLQSGNAARFKNAVDSISSDTVEANVSSHSSAGLCCCWEGSCTAAQLAKPKYNQHVWQQNQYKWTWYCCKTCAAGCMGGCPMGTKKPEEHAALKAHFLKDVGLINHDAILKNIKHQACPGSSTKQLPNAISKQTSPNQVVPMISGSESVLQPTRPVVQMTLNSVQERKNRCDKLVEAWQAEEEYEEYEKVKDDGNSLFHSLARHCGKACSPNGASRFAEKSCAQWDRFRTRVSNFVQQHPQDLSRVEDQYKQIHAAGLDLRVRIRVYSFGPFGGGAYDKLEYSERVFGLEPGALAPEYKFLQCANRWYPVSPSTQIVPSTCDK